MSEQAPAAHKLSTVEEAINAIRDGQFVVVVDDAIQETKGNLIIAADYADTAAINFMATFGRGLVGLAMQGNMLDRLQVPLMVPSSYKLDAAGPDFTVSVDAASGITHGMSAADRAHTVRTMIDQNSKPADLTMPGHVFALRARDGGVLARRNQTEAGTDLALLAGLKPAAALCEILSADGSLANQSELLAFASQHSLPAISLNALVDYKLKNGDSDSTTPPTQSSLTDLVTLIGTSSLPIEQGNFTATVFRDTQGLEHTAMVMGDLQSGTPLVRMHSECLTGDAFGSLRCDCGAQLQTSLQRIADAGNGILLYLRQEGRGIGLGNKIRAYALQETGLDTVDANEQLGFPADGREYDVAAAMLQHLGVSCIKLLTNNPEKRRALESFGVTINEQQPLVIPAHSHNIDYLQTKAKRMGHML